jgi:hypothetical protein
MVMLTRLIAAALALVFVAAAVEPAAAADVPLVPFNRFFGQTGVEAPLVSPDGKWVSYISRYQDAYNIFVGPVADIARAKPVTKERGRGLQWYTVSGAITYRWTPDSRYILYLKDNNGDENNRIYAVDVASGEVKNLTPGAKVRAHILAVSPTRPGHVLAAVDTSFPTTTRPCCSATTSSTSTWRRRGGPLL